MKSRYNLKRRVASLPPLSAEIFAEKVLAAQASSTAVAAKASFEKACVTCQRTYYSQNAYENHLRSQKHRLRASILAKDGSVTENGETGSVISSTISLGEPINGNRGPAARATNPPDTAIDPEAEAEFSNVVNGIRDTTITDEPVSRRPTRPHHSGRDLRVEHPLSPEKSNPKTNAGPSDSEAPQTREKFLRCLFCSTASSDLDDNINHMSKAHGLFVPERQYLIDLDGLVDWLWKRIHEEPHECLYCHRVKASAEAIQGHMRDAGHCKIAFEEEIDMIEVGQFYDFSSTYSDEELIDEEGDREMVAEAGSEDGWEDNSDVDSEDIDGEIEVGGGVSLTNGSPDNARVQLGSHARIVEDELFLPSGKVAGHRSLAKYFRQNLRDHPSPTERLEHQKLLEAAREHGSEDVLMTNGGQEAGNRDETGRGWQLISRANGGLGMLGVMDAKKREVQAVEKRDVKRAQRSEKQYQWGVNKRANNQKHFRDPLLQ